MGIEPISSSECNASALTVMLRCSKHRVRLELTINGLARTRMLNSIQHREMSVDHRLTNLATNAKIG